MTDEQLAPVLKTWLQGTDRPPADSARSTSLIMARLPAREERRPWSRFHRRAVWIEEAPDSATIVHQPGQVPATNGHAPTVIGRTRMMSSLAKAIAAGGLVVAIGSFLLVARPSEPNGPDAPGVASESDATAAAPEPAPRASVRWGAKRIDFTPPPGWPWPPVALGDFGGVGLHIVEFGAYDVARVAAECAGSPSSVSVGPTVEDLTRAIADLKGLEVSGPVDGFVGGYPAKRFVISHPYPPGCPASGPDGYVRIWENRDGTEVGMLDAGFAIVLIAEVHGERLVFTAWTPGHEFYGVYPGQGKASGKDVTQLEADADALAASMEIVSTPVAGEIAYAHAVYDPTGQESPRDLALFTVPSDDPSPRRPTRLADVPEDVPWPVSGLVGPVVRWSPDGSRIAFRLFHDEAGIWLMDRDGGDLHRLVDLPRDEGPQVPFLEAIDWSPDGTRIAYTYPYDGPRSPLYVVGVEDGQVTNLTGDNPSRGATRALAWSPDGSRIAFARTESDHRDGLFVMDADGTGEIRLTDPQLLGHLRGLTWAPDGERIAYIWESFGGPARTLKVVGADGSELRDISSWSAGRCCFLEATDLRPLAWSPDGDRIVMVVDQGLDRPEGQLETIMLVHADGSGQSELTKGSFFDLSPDGSRIVVAEARLDTDPGPYSIHVMDLDGTGVEWLADGEFPVWSPSAD